MLEQSPAPAGGGRADHQQVRATATTALSSCATTATPPTLPPPTSFMIGAPASARTWLWCCPAVLAPTASVQLTVSRLRSTASYSARMLALPKP